MKAAAPKPEYEELQRVNRLLQQELADTNREVLVLTLELEKRVDQRTAELRAAQDELQRTNSELMQLTLELEDRVAQRTRELESANQLLREEIGERRRTEGKLQAQLSRLDLMHRITRAIGERLDLGSMFQVVIGSLEEHLPLDFGCVCVYDKAANALTVTSVGQKSAVVAAGWASPQATGIDIDENGLARCAAGQLLYEPDIRLASFPFARELERAGLRSLVAAPLLVESKLFGILIAAHREAASFSSGECEFLRQLSEHVALAAHQAQLYDALQQAYEDLRRTQAAVMQQERLRALGQMASGIAHDINNSISPAALYTESLLEREPNLSDRARDYLTTIQRAVDDVAQTVSRMREFYRQRESQLELVPVRLNRLIEQVLELTRARWRDIPQERGIVLEVRTELDPALPDVLGAEGEIRDALTNLVLNAVDAMPGGGALRLRTFAALGSLRRAIVEVSDSGVGMDEETRRRCLEPFFTTKGERGTGLGLAMVYGMTQRHGAEIEIESEPGHGSTVRLIFPVPSQPADSATHSAEVSAPAERLRILVVDDDPLLIKSLRDALQNDGHEVHTADGGEAGLRLFSAALERGEPFSVVITDLGMPQVDGRKVAVGVKAASPATPVILLTGWGQRLTAEHDIPPHVDRLLNKPPKLRELRAALAELTRVERPEPGN